MAFRLNQLFQVSPQGFLERTVLFTDGLGESGSLALTSNRLVSNIDIEPVNTRSKARVLASLAGYSDTPMPSYFIPPVGSVLVPVQDTPYRHVFMPEFSHCRLLIQRDGDEWLRLSLDQGLKGMIPPAEEGDGASFADSINYWEFAADDLVGDVRATAVLVKETDRPWRFVMQRIVGPPGGEVVQAAFTRELRY